MPDEYPKVTMLHARGGEAPSSGGKGRMSMSPPPGGTEQQVADSYSKEAIDAKFDALRQEIRADFAEIRTDIATQVGAVRTDMANLRADIIERIGAVDRKVDVLIGQIKVWGFVLGFLMPVLLLVVNKLWK